MSQPTNNTAPAYLSPNQLFKKRFLRHKLATLSLLTLCGLYTIAIFAEFIAPYGPNEKFKEHTYVPPQSIHFSFQDGFHTPRLERHTDPITQKKYYIASETESVPLSLFVQGSPYQLWGLIPANIRLFGVDQAELAEGQPSQPFFLLGSDRFGRDLFSRIVFGGRISLSVGLLAIAISMAFGIIIGGISGYVGGGTDNIIQRSIEIINSFPQLPLWLSLAAILPRDWSPLKIYFAISMVLSLFAWTGLARVVRGKILSLREEDYAVAARLLGSSHRRILFKHLMPGFASHIIVSMTLAIPGMILGEVALSFLGLGLRPPAVSWGVMIQDTIYLQVVANYPWFLIPLFMIIITVLAFNYLGDGLRDAADPYA